MDFKMKIIITIILINLFIGCTINKRKKRDMSNVEISQYYNLICIGGHQYWQRNFCKGGVLANRLDDDGKPIKCGNK